jgi:signal recognition particle GTPase
MHTLPLRRQGLEKAKAEEFDAVIVDTAGRLQIDEKLMDELRQVSQADGCVAGMQDTAALMACNMGRWSC